MEQEGSLDFKALRAKFQEEAALRQMKNKPAIPEKPKLIPPPGARVSLLSSINVAVENKNPVIPRVVFKDAKTGSEAKRPLPVVPTKPPVRDSNFNMEMLDHQQKKEGDVVKQAFKDRKLPLVLPAVPVVTKSNPAPPPKSVQPKKKGFLAFKKFSKSGKESTQINTGPSNTSEGPSNTSEDLANASEGPVNINEGPANAIESAVNTNEGPANAIESAVNTNEGPANASESPVIIDEGPINTAESPVIHSESPVNISEGPIDTSESLANDSESLAITSEGPTSISESPVETSEDPTNTILGPTSISENLPSISEGSLNITDIPLIIDGVLIPPPLGADEIDGVLIPPPMGAEEIDDKAPKLDNENVPHEVDLCSEPQSLSIEMQDPPPSGDERADEVSTGSRTPPCDQRVLNALENAKRKFSPFNSLQQARPKSASPVNGDQSGEVTPSRLCPELPPIDYEDLIGRVPSAASVSPDNKRDGSSPREPSSSLEGSVEQGMEEIIPPPRQFLPDLESLGPPPEKPARPPSVDLGPYQATAPEAYVENALDTPALPDQAFSVPEFDTPECEPVELPVEVPQLEAPEVPDFETSDFDAQHLLTDEVGAVEYGEPEALDPGALNGGALDLGPPESEDVNLGDPDFGSQENETPEAEAPGTTVTDSPDSPICKESEPQPGVQQDEGHYESCDNVYEDVEAANKKKGQNGRKRKGPPKNPYADAQPVSEESHRSSWFFNPRNERKVSPEAHDDKELKKKEKQRLEKEKKEQKEREKKENEMKKKFKITGQEDAMYEAKVILPSKGRKNDLPVKTGDIISIIRTTDCPKGKWLARDSTSKYGYISVKSVELDIKEMLELGKKAQAAGRSTATEAETVSTGSRSSNHYPLSACSFTDDSEEWTCDDDDTLSPTENMGNGQTAPMVDMSVSDHTDLQHTVDDGSSDGNNMHAKHEALQKLATFFRQPRGTTETEIENITTAGTEEAPSLLCPVEESSYPEQEDVMEILPPPELYADSVDDLPSLPTIGVE
ncbi:titin isoform X2 [Conger conger]|uniref:titin isoform X2 n=1 Tax=Conger conger TaxID=82655 RepID=UPI002A5A7D62|nr:titin isoform X2 [Conger conger]